MLRRLKAIELYSKNVSRGKTWTYLKYGLALVPGRRQNIFISDINGKKFMNFHCNGGVFNFGHNYPDTVAALREAMEDADVGNALAHTPLRERLADELSRLMPGGISKILLCASGSEANEAAIKAALIHTGRSGVISASGAYHGGSGMAIAAGDPAFKAPFGPPIPGFRQIPFGDISALEAALDNNAAAVILETIPATLGMKMPPDDYFQKVRALCDERGSVMIIDEVQTGLGRTGKLWAIEHWGAQPDIIVVGKGLSGGVYPIAAACFKPKFEYVFSSALSPRISEYSGGDLGCAVAVKTLQTCSGQSFLDRVNRMADIFENLLNDIKREFPEYIIEIRQKGLFIGIVLRDENISMLTLKTLFNNGIYTVYAGNDKRVIQFLPPLIITEQQAREAAGLVRKSIRDLAKPANIILLNLLKLISPKTV